MRHRLFVKFFISFLAVILVSVTASIAVERFVVRNQSDNKVMETIEDLIEFRGELIDLLEDEETQDAAQLLLKSPEYQNQFYVFDDYDNEILERDFINTPPRSRFNHQLSKTFEEYDIPLTVEVETLLGNQYTIITKPLMRFRPFFSPKTAGTLIRLGLFILLSSIVCYFLAWRFTRTIKQLRTATQKIAAGDYDAFPNNMQFSKDELGQLGREFQHMSHELRDSTAQKKQMLSDISHELRSPLARLQIALEIARNQHPEITAPLNRIEKESNRMNTLIGQILTIQKAQTQTNEQLTDIDIQALLTQIINDVSYEYQQTTKAITLSSETPMILQGQYSTLHSAIENVIRNAMAHTAENTSVIVNVQEVDKQCRITVNDSGSGIAEDKLAAIFQPFTRLDNSRTRETGGYGLGLSISHSIITAHHGQITAVNRRDENNNIIGLSVIIELPITE